MFLLVRSNDHLNRVKYPFEAGQIPIWNMADKLIATPSKGPNWAPWGPMDKFEVFLDTPRAISGQEQLSVVPPLPVKFGTIKHFLENCSELFYASAMMP